MTISCFLAFLQSVWLTVHALLTGGFPAHWVCSSNPAEQSASKHTLTPTSRYVPLVFSVALATAILTADADEKSELAQVKLVRRKSCQLVLSCVCGCGCVSKPVLHHPRKLDTAAARVETNWTAVVRKPCRSVTHFVYTYCDVQYGHWRQ